MQDRFSRQTFLGDAAEEDFETCRVGIVGLGGGGSHVAQQLLHLGFKDLVVFDSDVVEASNLNRLVGATEFDARWATPKVAVAQRLAQGIAPDARVEAHRRRWQDEPLALRECDLVFACLDGFAARRELEATCRRFLIPLIDIGLDVHCVEDDPPRMAGQIIVSLPGHLCMSCLGFLNEKTLAKEAARYGDAGVHPQVVWANGVLASTAVGIGVNLLTGWSGKPAPCYLTYDANAGTVTPHSRLLYLDLTQPCLHYPLSQVGEPRFEAA